MSLPDTIFIFVLALIIFGPKKLPEIGRQIGRLVGEFRRASNEFKFQIEEELRQVDLNDRRTQQHAIATKTESVPENRILEQPVASGAGEVGESLPVGQHPNIENLDVSTLNIEAAPSEAADEPFAEPPTAPTIEVAEGSEPRSAIPYAHVKGVAEIQVPAEYIPQDGKPSTNGTADSTSTPQFSADNPTLEPLTHADVHHG